MKEALVEKDMTCLLEAAKSDLMIGLKHKEASLYKLKLGQRFPPNKYLISDVYLMVLIKLRECVCVCLSDFT